MRINKGFWVLSAPNSAILLVDVTVQPKMSLVAKQNSVHRTEGAHNGQAGSTLA